MELTDRFWSKTARVGDCLVWTGCLRADGRYGSFYLDGRMVSAHRLALEHKLGRPIAPGMFACHTCDNKTCVNGGHLYEGTPSENLLDAYRRNRKPGRQKLTAEDVSRIRDLCADGATQRWVAGQFGIAQSHVNRLVNRKQWKVAA